MAEETPLTAREKAKTAWEYWVAGMDDEEIASELGYANRSGAFKARKRHEQLVTIRGAAEVRSRTVARLDALALGLWAEARNGDLFAVDRALKIEDMIAKLYGLYDQKTDDTTAEARAAIVGFREGLKGLFGPDDTYGQVSDDASGSEDVPVDGEPGA